MNENTDWRLADFVAIKALEDGVTIIGLTRGKETRISHTEKLDAGQVMLAQFTENVAAMKIEGRVEIYTKFGKITGGDI
ncbi:MAG: trp RNA-binding attenuation protein MtrB [bacterium]